MTSKGNLIPTPTVDKNGRATTVYKKQLGKVASLFSVPKLKAASSTVGREELISDLTDDLDDVGTSDCLGALRDEALGTVHEVHRGYTLQQRTVLLNIMSQLYFQYWNKKNKQPSQRDDTYSRRVTFCARTVPVFEAMFPGDPAAVTDRMMDFMSDSTNLTMIDDMELAAEIPCAYAIRQTIDKPMKQVLSDEQYQWLDDNAKRLLPVLPVALQRGILAPDALENLIAANHAPVLLDGAL